MKAQGREIWEAGEVRACRVGFIPTTASSRRTLESVGMNPTLENYGVRAVTHNYPFLPTFGGDLPAAPHGVFKCFYDNRNTDVPECPELPHFRPIALFDSDPLRDVLLQGFAAGLAPRFHERLREESVGQARRRNLPKILFTQNKARPGIGYRLHFSETSSLKHMDHQWLWILVVRTFTVLPLIAYQEMRTIATEVFAAQ